MTYDFTAKDVLNEVIRLSEEDPDFIYTTQPGRESNDPCGYAGLALGTTQGRSCIVGQALQNLGVPESQLCRLVGGASRAIKDNLQVEGSADVFRLLNCVQRNQDSGLPWGESVRKALSVGKVYV